MKMKYQVMTVNSWMTWFLLQIFSASIATFMLAVAVHCNLLALTAFTACEHPPLFTEGTSILLAKPPCVVPIRSASWIAARFHSPCRFVHMGILAVFCSAFVGFPTSMPPFDGSAHVELSSWSALELWWIVA